MNILSTKFPLRVLSLCAFLILGLNAVSAQSPEFSLNSQEACFNGDLSVPISVQNFDEITSFQYTIAWDNQMLSFDTVSFYNPILGNNLLFGTNMTDDGILTVSWFDNSVMGVDLDDAAIVFTVDFTSLGANESNTDVTFENSPTMKEVSKILEDINGMDSIGIVPANYNNGEVIVAQPELASVMITNDTDDSNIGAVDITISSGTEPYSYFWSNGVDTEDLTNVGAGVYSVDVTDAKGCQENFGEFTVDNIVGTSHLETLTSVNIFPNPANEQIHLTAGFDTPQNIEVAIYNIFGQKVFSQTADDLFLKLDLDVSRLATGNYLLTLQSGAGIHTEKIEIIR